MRQNDSVEILNIEKAFKGVIKYLIKLYFWSDLVYVKDRTFLSRKFLANWFFILDLNNFFLVFPQESMVSHFIF